MGVKQTIHRLMCEALRGVLVAAVGSGSGAGGGIGSIQCRACAVLYLLLRDHQIDRRGRCRSCRRRGAIVERRRRVCLVFVEANYWLCQPTRRVLAHLAGELGVDLAPLPDPNDQPTDPSPLRITPV
jgi:hypothetical protein